MYAFIFYSSNNGIKTHVSCRTPSIHWFVCIGQGLSVVPLMRCSCPILCLDCSTSFWHLTDVGNFPHTSLPRAKLSSCHCFHPTFGHKGCKEEFRPTSLPISACWLAALGQQFEKRQMVNRWPEGPFGQDMWPKANVQWAISSTVPGAKLLQWADVPSSSAQGQGGS